MSKNKAKEQQKNDFYNQRFKNRMIQFITESVKDPNQHLEAQDIAQYMKSKIFEYQRKDFDSIHRQVTWHLDQCYMELHGTNVNKPSYRKKEVILCPEEVIENKKEPIIDKYGEELVEQKSTTLNSMIPSMAQSADAIEKAKEVVEQQMQQANEDESVLGKREADDKDQSGQQNKGTKRVKLSKSYTEFNQEKKDAQQTDELLSKYLIQSTVKYSDLGGMDDTIKALREMIEWPIDYQNIFEWLGVQTPRGLLINGPPGTGKTQLAMAIAGENPNIPFYKLNGPEIVSGISGSSEEKIRKLFNGVKEKAPAVVFIDELDSIAGKRENASKDMEVRIVAQISSCMDDLAQSNQPVIVIGATSRAETIDQGLRRAGRFEREITIGIPNEQAKIQILKILTREMRMKEDFPFEEIVRATPGYVGADLHTLCKEAGIIAMERIIRGIQDTKKPETNKSKESETGEDSSDDVDLDPEQCFVEYQDFKQAAKKVQPSAQREGFSTVPNTSWSDVGALVKVREELKMSIVEPIVNPERFLQIGLSAPAGVLLFGPPGCGKTLVAKAVSNESKANFISVKGPELLNKYVGESEKSVRQLFKRANASAPCVIFFDELDSLCPKRGSENNSSSERVVNQLLTEMDGLEERRGVFVIAATNRPDIIDPAMLRPGRLDKLLYVPLPSKEDRHQILKTVCRKVPIADDVDLKKISIEPHCEGFSGADLSALVREAQLNTLRSAMKVTDPKLQKNVQVHHKDFVAALQKVFPSVSKRDELSYKALEGGLRKSRSSINNTVDQQKNALPVGGTDRTSKAPIIRK